MLNLTTYISNHLSIYQSIHLNIDQAIDISINPFIFYQFIHSFTDLSSYLFSIYHTFLSICLSVYPSIPSIPENLSTSPSISRTASAGSHAAKSRIRRLLLHNWKLQNPRLRLLQHQNAIQRSRLRCLLPPLLLASHAGQITFHNITKTPYYAFSLNKIRASYAVRKKMVRRRGD